MALKIRSTSSLDNLSWIEPIGNLTDFNDLFQDLQKQAYQSVDWMKLMIPKDDKLWHLIEGSYSDVAYQSLLALFEVLSENSSTETVIPVASKEFTEGHKQRFIETIQNVIFEAGEDNAATEMMAELLVNHKEELLKLLNTLFVDNYEDTNLCVKILSLLGDYSYEELKPYSQSIALASIANKSPRIKSAALNLFAHWGNKDALRLLMEVDEPTEPWIKMKYLSIKKSLEERCSMQEK
jgi:hypothetical protein